MDQLNAADIEAAEFDPEAEDETTLARSHALVMGESSETSERFGGAILDRVRLPASQPRIGALIPGRKGVRRMLFTPVRIYYRIDERRKTVEIIRILRTSRKAPPT